MCLFLTPLLNRYYTWVKSNELPPKSPQQSIDVEANESEHRRVLFSVNKESLELEEELKSYELPTIKLNPSQD